MSTENIPTTKLNSTHKSLLFRLVVITTKIKHHTKIYPGNYSTSEKFSIYGSTLSPNSVCHWSFPVLVTWYFSLQCSPFLSSLSLCSPSLLDVQGPKNNGVISSTAISHSLASIPLWLQWRIQKIWKGGAVRSIEWAWFTTPTNYNVRLLTSIRALLLADVKSDYSLAYFAMR